MDVPGHVTITSALRQQLARFLLFFLTFSFVLFFVGFLFSPGVCCCTSPMCKKRGLPRSRLAQKFFFYSRCFFFCSTPKKRRSFCLPALVCFFCSTCKKRGHPEVELHCKDQSNVRVLDHICIIEREETRQRERERPDHGMRRFLRCAATRGDDELQCTPSQILGSAVQHRQQQLGLASLQSNSSDCAVVSAALRNTAKADAILGMFGHARSKNYGPVQLLLAATCKDFQAWKAATDLGLALERRETQSCTAGMVERDHRQIEW